ncbi:unnamed protein product, partial [Laminaria digitata]
YFLSDSTISIEEPRITNSGLTQGKFMRRLQVSRGGNGGGNSRPRRDIYAPGDFGVGEEVWIHGRRFRIVDADVTTRKWFKLNLGRELKEKEDYPEDGYGAQRAKVSVPKKR